MIILKVRQWSELHTLEDDPDMVEDDLDKMQDDPKMYKIAKLLFILMLYNDEK